MKVKLITCEHTRQVRQFEPVKFSITAEIGEGENAYEAAKKLQELVLMVTYKDDPKQLKHLVDSLIDFDKKEPSVVQYQQSVKKTNRDSKMSILKDEPNF